MKSVECKSTEPWSSIRLIFLVNLAICAGVFLLSLVFQPEWTMRQLWRQLLGNWVYSNSIGFLAALIVPRVAFRVSKYHPLKRWTLYIAVLVGVGATGAFIANAILVLPRVVPMNRFLEYYRESAAVAILLTVLIGVGAHVLDDLRHKAEASTRELRRRQYEHEHALKLAMEARLSSLESRLKPHFLFNTINSVLSLIREEPRSAEEMLERLSRLLRFSLDTQERRVVPLAEELRLVEDYLGIERTRFGSRLRFEIDAPQEMLASPVPPYVLQTLVENSMKYAVAPRRDGGAIRVRVARAGAGIAMEVSDDGPGFTRDALVAGHGLDTLERRLETLYGGRAELSVENHRGALVRVVVPEGGTA